MKPDLTGVKILTKEELRARREARERGIPRKKKRARFTQVASVSIPKHLKIRVELEIGDGSFSRGVVKACTAFLAQLDRQRDMARRQ